MAFDRHLSWALRQVYLDVQRAEPPTQSEETDKAIRELKNDCGIPGLVRAGAIFVREIVSILDGEETAAFVKGEMEWDKAG